MTFNGYVQAATKTVESALKASKTEVGAMQSRMTNFRKIMQKMQVQLKSTKEFEDKAKVTEESLQKEIVGLKQQLDAVEAAAKAASRPDSKEAAPADATVVSEKPHVAKDAEKEAPAPVTEETNAQQKVNEKREASSTAPSPVPAKDTLSTKTKAQPDAKAEATERAMDIAVNKDEPKKAGADTTVPAKKKGRKRKVSLSTCSPDEPPTCLSALI